MAPQTRLIASRSARLDAAAVAFFTHVDEIVDDHAAQVTQAGAA